MRLLIDLSSINKKNVNAGIPIYMFRLVDSLYKKVHKGIILFVDASLFSYFSDLFPNFKIHCIKRNYILYKIPFFHKAYAKWSYKRALAKVTYDAELIASDQDRGTTTITNHKRIYIIHDLKGLKDGSSLIRKENFAYYKKMINSADLVIAISNYTKQDIQVNYPNLKKEIKVLYNLVQICKYAKQPNDFNEKDYLLYVNTLQEYKNPLTLIKAFGLIKSQIKQKLVVVGKPTHHWNKVILPLIKKLGIADRIVHLHDLSTAELKYVYENAFLFISTSLREGFGYTPIEAAMCRVPVLTTNCEALADTTQGLLNYYEPATDENVLAKEIIKLLKSPPSKELLNRISVSFQELYSPQTFYQNLCKILAEFEHEHS